MNLDPTAPRSVVPNSTVAPPLPSVYAPGVTHILAGPPPTELLPTVTPWQVDVKQIEVPTPEDLWGSTQRST
jgi:hypothetical protein